MYFFALYRTPFALAMIVMSPRVFKISMTPITSAQLLLSNLQLIFTKNRNPQSFCLRIFKLIKFKLCVLTKLCKQIIWQALYLVAKF